MFVGKLEDKTNHSDNHSDGLKAGAGGIQGVKINPGPNGRKSWNKKMCLILDGDDILIRFDPNQYVPTRVDHHSKVGMDGEPNRRATIFFKKGKTN